jgi:predicted transglutaminase-like cysteine proteinase
MFCTRDPAECVGSRNVAAVDPTFGRMADLDDVNSAVNHQIAPRPDPTADDNWTLFPKAGDCEDYAVSKRHVLIGQGWPASSLRLAIGKTERGEGHLVLIARTDDGDVVLDNLTDEVKPWNKVDLHWISIQSSTDPKIWYALM